MSILSINKQLTDVTISLYLTEFISRRKEGLGAISLLRIGVFVVLFFGGLLFDFLGVNRRDKQILEEATVLEHSRPTFEGALSNLNLVTLDAEHGFAQGGIDQITHALPRICRVKGVT